ncbi:FixJ family two-component response regulator [Sphingomonas naasensis]|uniref:Response regulator n=1 Tax=Sphingomonas naasensis TaxID=1344951 RepID=A0A4S1W8P6_9SPHN|nr:response regulator [Sphingomonas naasensis]NIJ20676.1 FixJ family two-component response regulator [Sphingomonas naasensis]TGX37600.1 response regulator [Sphingomonas naasensis]
MTASAIIAIVDDDPDVRGSLDSLMRSAGLAPRCFASAEALLADPEAIPACVVTDLHMPGMTGLELQAELIRRGRAQPLILMTAFPTDAARDLAMDAGAAAFLTKPVDPDALLDAIERAIR